MLLLFVLSITPKHFLHAVFADHQDVAVNTTHQEEDTLRVAGFLCDTHDQVVESPYTSHIWQTVIETPLLFPSSTTQHLITNLRLQVPVATDLRGPPALA